MKKLAIAMLAVAAMTGAPTGAFAAQSCSDFQNLCAARCKQRLPDDKNCVADHCTPKLKECRVTGCWQEGRLYGGGKTCDLTKR